MSMQIRPQDLPELRAELTTFLSGLNPGAIQNAAHLLGAEVPSDWLAFHYGQTQKQATGLAHAELFFVEPAMISLAGAAGASLPPFTLEPEDIPAPFGFIYFAEPLELANAPETDPTWAASWRPDGANGLHIDWYNDLEALSAHAPDDGSLLATSLRKGPPLQALTNTQIRYGEHGTYGEAHQGAPLNDSRKAWLNTLKAIWLLMQQPLASVVEQQPDRAARRRLRRLEQEPATVRVIALRRTKGASGPGSSDREYHHQWIVRGHWRQQWHPKRQLHRPVWIAPHIKGPEGAPLIGGEKVYALKR